MNLRDKIVDADGARELAVHRFLESKGWKYTSEMGALWLWKKEIEGKLVYVNESSAIWLCDHDYT